MNFVFLVLLFNGLIFWRLLFILVLVWFLVRLSNRLNPIRYASNTVKFIRSRYEIEFPWKKPVVVLSWKWAAAIYSP